MANMTGTVYEVVVKTAPCASEIRQHVGCYLDEATAVKVAKLIEDLNTRKHPQGIKVLVEECQAKLLKTPDGLMLKQSPSGCPTKICQSIDRDEYWRLAHMTFEPVTGD